MRSPDSLLSTLSYFEGACKVKFRVFRWDPSSGKRPRYDIFEIVPREKMSVLDALVAIQAEQDPTLSFRHSCRAGMCGTCAMMVNGVPRWTCRTALASLGAGVVTLQPLRHFQVVKDLMVDMSDFFGKYRKVIPHVVAAQESDEAAIILPTEEGRLKIADNLECIGCGCCYAACDLAALDPDYLGPHALNRAYTLVHDRRDAAREDRLRIVDSEHGCWRCHTQTACMSVCPKEINTSDAVQDLKREVLAYRRDQRFVPEAAQIPAEQCVLSESVDPESSSRREFLHASTALALGAAALAVGIPLAGAALSPAMGSREQQWVKLGPLDEFPTGRMVEKRYLLRERGWFDKAVSQTIYVIREKGGAVQALSPSCTHLGCPVRWNETSRIFLCPCHGGVFDEHGKNTGGPPTRPLDRMETRVANGTLYLRRAL